MKGVFAAITDEERKQQLLALYQDDMPLIREIIQASETTFPYFVLSRPWVKYVFRQLVHSPSTAA